MLKPVNTGKNDEHEKILRELMQLADSYGEECAQGHEWPNYTNIQRTRTKLKARLGELIRRAK